MTRGMKRRIVPLPILLSGDVQGGMDTESLSYPIGRFVPEAPSADARRRAVADIGAMPGHLSTAILGLSDAQLDTPYRPDGWTVRQVVHHVADSHMNAFVRLKLALTEDRPRVAAYDEKKFATLSDTRFSRSMTTHSRVFS